MIVHTDAKTFHRLEEWKLDPEDHSRTIYLKRVTSYQRAVARLGYRASGGSEEAASLLFISGANAAAQSRSLRDQVSRDKIHSKHSLMQSLLIFRWNSHYLRTLREGYIRPILTHCISSSMAWWLWRSRSRHHCMMKPHRRIQILLWNHSVPVPNRLKST
jgi:hypothetical protein